MKILDPGWLMNLLEVQNKHCVEVA